MSEVTVRLRQRNGTAGAWTSADTVLKTGEIGYETDTGWHKLGDGITAWTSLLYYHGPPWLQAVDGGAPTSTYDGAPTTPWYGIMASAPIA